MLSTEFAYFLGTLYRVTCRRDGNMLVGHLAYLRPHLASVVESDRQLRASLVAVAATLSSKDKSSCNVVGH